MSAALQEGPVSREAVIPESNDDSTSRKHLGTSSRLAGSGFKQEVSFVERRASSAFANERLEPADDAFWAPLQGLLIL